MKKIVKNISLFSNAGIGEYGTSNINNELFKVETIIANELLEERANIYKKNYPNCNMIVGSIVNNDIFNKIITLFNLELPTSGTFSPPCQGSSGLNAFKNKSNDFRNQLIKSIFKLFDKVKENSLEIGYIENIVSYYNEEIPVIYYKSLNNSPQLLNEYIIDIDNNYLNYKYFILSNNYKILENYNKNNIYELEKNNFYNKKFCLGINNLQDIKLSENTLIKNLKKINEDLSLIKSITIKEYIEKSLNKYGFKGELKKIRGEEYGSPQIRQRGFYIFYKKNLNIFFPKPLYTIYKKNKYFNGKTILDSFKIMNLIKIYSLNEIDLNKIKNNYKIINNKVYVDTAISLKEGQKELDNWKNNNYNVNKLPNLHFQDNLQGRYLEWVKNTKEGLSAYKNKKRYHRPYKIIKVEKNLNNQFIIKRDNKLIIKEDNKSYFKKNYIIDYVEYLEQKIKDKDKKEWGIGKRNWKIESSKDRKELELKLINLAKNKINKKENTFFYIFFPIKGFEDATYKRNNLNQPINAITTKMNYGNSNTVHPIFNRCFTPAEIMSMFGLGYKLINNEYIRDKSYIPPLNIINIKKFQNVLYEICGEAIITIVAEKILDDLLKQLLNELPNR